MFVKKFHRRKRLRRGFRRFLIRHAKRMVLSFVALFLIGNVIASFVFPTEYVSETTIAPINRLGDDSHFNNSVDLLAESHNLASLFASLYNNREVVSLVQQRMGWEHLSQNDIVHKIQVTRTVKTLIVNVIAKDVDPQTAQKLSQVYADAMIEVLTSPLSINNVELLRKASEPQKTPSWPWTIPAVLILSCILVLVLEWFWFLFDPALSSPKDIERYRYPVFGTLPSFRPESISSVNSQKGDES